jgi:ubiquinone/menaquinone biosynthesis C-methylase UbiE
MLFKLKWRSKKKKIPVVAVNMDARYLEFPDETFDVVFLHMIIAVIPESEKAIKEVERVLKPGGRVMLFDKLLPEHQSVSWFRKIINPAAILIASDLNKKLSQIIERTAFEKVMDEPAGWGGLLRVIKLIKKN